MRGEAKYHEHRLFACYARGIRGITMTKVDAETEVSIDKAVEEIDESQPEESLGATSMNVEEKPEVEELPTQKRVKSVRKKKILIAAVVAAAVVAIISAVPFLRYGLVGTVYAKPVSLKIVDSVTNKPVSGATVTIGRVSATSDKTGVARFEKVSVGDHYMTIDKKYYEQARTSVLVPIFSDVKDATRSLKATGRTISVSVKQTLTKQALPGVEVKLGDATAATDISGVAQVVVSVDAGTLNGTVTLDSYNAATFTVDTKKNDDQSVEISMVPVGSLYYLSKATGTINLMKSNLDGSGASIAVQGTGKEFDRETMILATNDWRYIVLQANRDGKTKLYLVDTKDNSLTRIDDDDASYAPVGWIDRTFVYQVSRNRAAWQSGQSAIKLYAADSRKLTTLEESQASGSSYYDYTAQYTTMPIINNGVIEYGRYWSASYTGSLSDKKSQILSADIRGVKHVLKEFPGTSSVGYLVASSLDNAFVSVYDSTAGKSTVYQVTGGKVSQATIDDTTLGNTSYPTRHRSATGAKTAWHEARDGKYYVFVGDSAGGNGKQLTLVDYRVYGWFGDNYLLLTKNGSELYIYPVGVDGAEVHKVTDYHKPAVDYMGMGYGATA